jgi:two-component system sensor histidine kinase CreC
VSIRLKIFLGLLIIFAAGFYLLVDFIINDIRPRYLETIEESMTDTAVILSTFVESGIDGGNINSKPIELILTQAQKKHLDAKIYALRKTELRMYVYITNKKGIVIYDSENGKREGKDFSRWRDIYRTLRGQYGTRSSRSVADDPFSNSLYVASPIKLNNEIIGALTVVKPEDSVSVFITLAERKIVIAGILSFLAFTLLGFILSMWISHPIVRLTDYIKSMKEGARLRLPIFAGKEIRNLAYAFDELWTELNGKKYIEQYIQTLTHELKSPLSSIRGAVELLDEGVPDEQRKTFYRNIYRESRRIESVIEKLLQLSSIENRTSIKDVEKINLDALITDILESLLPQCTGKNISITKEISPDLSFSGERFLIRHALVNLLDNAIRHAPNGGLIHITGEADNTCCTISIRDNGSGIPDFAVNRIFEKFYSLPDDQSHRKGTGLGLPFVREVALLHGGSVEIINNNDHGVTARLTLPLMQENDTLMITI